MPKTINHEFWWAYAKVEATELTNLSIILARLPCLNFLPTTPKMAFSCSSLELLDDQAWAIPETGYLLRTVDQNCEFDGKGQGQSPCELWYVYCWNFASQRSYISSYLGSSHFCFYFPLSSCLYFWLCGNLPLPFSLKSSPTFTVSVPVPLPWLFLLSFSFNSYHQNVVMRSVFKCPSLTSVQPGIFI